MNLLHVGLCVNYKDEGLNHALRNAFTGYKEISTGEKSLDNKILAALTDEGRFFDVVFFQIQSENIVHPNTFHQLREYGSLTVNWSGDMRRNTPDWYFRTGAWLTLFSNEQDVNALKARGMNADFLQIGIDPKAYNRWGESRPAREIVFMANNYGNQFPLGNERGQIITELQQRFGNRFGVYGNGWRSTAGNLNAVSLEGQREESMYYNNAKIAINHSHFDCCRYTSDRLFRILGSGCFCLSHHYQGIEKDFEVGKHLDTYRTRQEMINKINFYLAHDDIRQNVADAGYEHCHKNFTYKQMADNLYNLIEEWQ